MTPKKKVTKPIAKKKVKSSSVNDIKLILNSNDASPAPPKSPKEKLPSKALSTVKTGKLKIYEDENFQKPLNQLNLDMIKILTKNPLEACIFWNIRPETFQKSLDHFHASSESIKIEICLEYMDIEGSKKTVYIPTHPLSNSYYYKFERPVDNLKALIYANHSDGQFLLLDSAHVSLPSDKASLKFDEQWINQEWIESGLIARDAKGNYTFHSDNKNKSEVDFIYTKTMSIGSSGNTSSRAIGS